MKKIFIDIGIRIMCILTIITCASSIPTATSAPSAGTAQPQYGGILRIVYINVPPKNLGWEPERGQVDTVPGLLYSERYTAWDKDGKLIPILCESVKEDMVNKTITFYLRKGIKFQDGTPFNAEAAKWQVQQTIDYGSLQYRDKIQSLEIVDDYTLRYNLKEWNNQMLEGFAFTRFFSPTAIKTNGIDWARQNAYTTGPFKITRYKRDAYLICEKYKDYWQPGKPYLDGVEMRFIPDPMTAAAALQAGEADLIINMSPFMAIDLEKKGYLAKYVQNTFYHFVPDTKNSDSIYINKKVREAVEYAVDRPAIAQALGKGKIVALNQLAPPFANMGYDANYKGRLYDPAKAKQLLAEAGYPNGFKTTIITRDSQFSRDLAAAVQGFLTAVGIEAKIDVADTARYANLQLKGWKDGLFISGSGIDPNFLVAFVRQFSSNPTAVLGSMNRSPEFLALEQKVLQATDDTSKRRLAQQWLRQASEDVMSVPICTYPNCMVMQKYVHTTYGEVIAPVMWNIFDDWMEKH